MRVQLTKLFRSPKEGEDWKPSVVTYYKSPYVMSVQGVSQYRHHLVINLWLLVIDHSWIGKDEELYATT